MEANRLGDSKGVAVIIVVDTNFLMMMTRGLITPLMIFEALGASFKLVSPVAVEEELRRLSELAPSHTTRRLARRALEIAKGLKVEFVNDKYSHINADDAIELLALDLRASGKYVAVATSDRELRRRLRDLGIPSVYYRESEARLETELDVI